MSIPRVGRVVGVDWGEIRLGLALSDETQTLSSPLGTLLRRRGKRFPMPQFESAIVGMTLVGIVVGLPLTLAGEEGPSSGAARAVADLLMLRTGLPVDLWDERMSTARALGIVREVGGSTRGRRAEVDALAASVLLQHYLDARRGGTT